MNKMIALRGGHAGEMWPVGLNHSTLIGRGREDGHAVNLDRDRRVSRMHARVWQNAGQWWIEDLGSRNGTRLCGREIAGAGPIPLDPGLPLEMGGSVLILATEDWRRVSVGESSLEFRFPGVISLSLAYAGLEPVTGLVVRNDTEAPSEEVRVRLTLEGYGGSGQVIIPALNPGDAALIETPHFRWIGPVLENQIEAGMTSLVVSAVSDGSVFGRESCRVLAHNEWSMAPLYRDSLASFVLPNHPVVARLAQRIRQEVGATEEGRAGDLLTAAYRFFSEQCDFVYAECAPSFERESQKVRLPHQMMPDPTARCGEGTCVDLAVIVAACLENLGCEPVIALVDLGATWHALVGIKGPRALGGLPHAGGSTGGIPTADRVIDPTGFALCDGQRLSLQEAKERAVSMMLRYPTVCGIDVLGCRKRGCLPLPFAGEPGLSVSVASAMGRAKEIAARRGRSKAGASHLFLALMELGDGAAAAAFERLGMTIESIAASLDDPSSKAEASEGGESYHFDMAIAGAKTLAKRCGSPIALEEHLLVALVELGSEAISELLSSAGSSAEQVMAVLAKICPEVVGSASDWMAASELQGNRRSKNRSLRKGS